MLVRKRHIFYPLVVLIIFVCIDLILIVLHWLGICCVSDISLNIYVMLFTISPSSNVILFVHVYSSSAFLLLIAISTRSFVLSNCS